MTSPRIILGSTSLYKRQLLAQVVKDFTVEDSQVDERAYHQTTVKETVRVLAEEKAHALLAKHRGTNTIIITTDVVGELQGKFLGKPESLHEARDMIRSYSGRDVIIWCGTTITNAATGKMLTDVQKAVISFNGLTDEMIEKYLQDTQPLDKGGAIAIEEIEEQGFVKSVTGEYAAIIGISMQFVKRQLGIYHVL